MIHEKMLADLQALGVKQSGTMLVHSSYKSLGAGVEGIEQVIETLRAALGDEGTLLIPTLSYESVPADKRVFHVSKTPSDVGAITEYFRKMPGVVRSLHPTHSVAAVGKNAAIIVKNHHKDDSPVGANSPFRKLRDLGGQILMLGCGLKPNTSMHGVEELAEPPYGFRGHLDYICTDAEGVEHKLSIRRHNFKNPHGGYVDQRYDRLKFILPGYIMASGKVLDAECYLFEAKPMWDIAEKVMRDDPLFFVDGWYEA
jgi:aminoglycoside 3-N-acetyltransferase